MYKIRTSIDEKQEAGSQRITDNRALHMHGVAEYMYEHAKDYELNPEDMFLLGWLHDVGYIYQDGDHAELGEKLLNRNHYPLLYSTAVAAHSDELEKKAHVSKELQLLVEADMHVSSITGKRVPYDQRLREIAVRHGRDSEVYRRCESNITFLRRNGRP